MTRAADPKTRGKPALTRKRVLDAALKIVDESGPEALSMRAVAREIGVYPNAVYWHVGSRTQLIGAVSTLVFDEVTLPDAREHRWDDWLGLVAREWRAAMYRHPNIAAIAGTQLATTTRAMPIVERILSVLADAGFEDAALINAYNTFVGFLLGWLTVELSREPEPDDSGWKEEFAADLDQIDPNTFPTLARAMPKMRNSAFMTRWDSGQQRPMEESFDAALHIVLVGLRAVAPK